MSKLFLICMFYVAFLGTAQFNIYLKKKLNCIFSFVFASFHSLRWALLIFCSSRYNTMMDYFSLLEDIRGKEYHVLNHSPDPVSFLYTFPCRAIFFGWWENSATKHLTIKKKFQRPTSTTVWVHDSGSSSFPKRNIFFLF